LNKRAFRENSIGIDATETYQHLHRHKDLLGVCFLQRAANQGKKNKYKYQVKKKQAHCCGKVRN